MVHVISHVVFPLVKDPDVLPLYLDAETWTTVRHEPVRVSSNAHLDDVLSRSSFRVKAGHRVSFASYFNAFPASFWQQFTTVREVILRLTTTGDGSLLVFRSNSQGVQQRVETVDLTGNLTTELRLPVSGFGDGGWYWFDVSADNTDVVLTQGDWLTEDEPRVTSNASVAMTTFNKPDYAVATLARFAAEKELMHEIDTIYVVDQGDRLVADQPEYAAVSADLGSQLRIVNQPNLGGSGGFSRGMAETLDAGTSGFTLLLDDDVEIEPESVFRSITFSRFCVRPTIVGGHMFDLLDKPVLHAFAETINPFLFLWQPIFNEQMRHDLRTTNLRQTPWMHQLLLPDYNGWWMCMIPTEILSEIGLSLPVFIKWDDAEYALRARDAGYSTVSFPGAALWHVSWLDKDDSQDWQAYYHARNRLLAGLLHSHEPKGGFLLKNSHRIDIKHLFCMQYYATELRHLAIRDLLSGPEHLHATMAERMPQLRAMTKDFIETQVITDPAQQPTAVQGRRVYPPNSDRMPNRFQLGLFTARNWVRQFLSPVPPEFADRPQVELSKADATWWRVPAFDSALISTADGRGKSVYRRDRARFRSLFFESRRLHRELDRRWDELVDTYRGAMPEFTSPEAWKRTFGAD